MASPVLVLPEASGETFPTSAQLRKRYADLTNRDISGIRWYRVPAL
jgi:hypothetical protein